MSASGIGGHSVCYAAVRLDVVVVQYGHTTYLRLLVNVAGVPEAARKSPVEALLLVGVIHEVPNVDVAYVDGDEVLQRAECLLEGYTVLVHTIPNCTAGSSDLTTAAGPARSGPSPEISRC